jgi:hypothetical protein
MLQKLGDHIASCVARPDDAERRSSQASDSETKAESERMAKAWRHLARSYQFVESLERFLLDGRTTKNILPLPAPALLCPKCDHAIPATFSLLNAAIADIYAATGNWSG